MCPFVCVSVSFPCARPLLPSSARSAGQRNQPSHSTVLARPVCPFVCVSAASFQFCFSLTLEWYAEVIWLPYGEEIPGLKIGGLPFLRWLSEIMLAPQS